MRWRALCLFFLKHSKPSKSLQKLKSYDSERILLSQSGDLRVVELWVQVECKLGHKQDQIWLLNNKKNSDHGKTPRDHAVSRKKIRVLWESVSRWMFAWRHFEWFCWPPNEVNCYRKTKFDFWTTKKIRTTAKLPEITQFQGKNSGCSESLYLDGCLRDADPDKKK